jgi:hypothetical protein
MWKMNRADDLFGPSPLGQTWSNVAWQEASRFAGSIHVGAGRAILERYEWWRLVPHQEWVSPSAEPCAPMNPYAAGIPRELRVLYFPRMVAPWGTAYQVCAIEPDTAYRAAFINPCTGEAHRLGTVNAGSDGQWQVPVAPVLHDWVLVLERVP